VERSSYTWVGHTALIVERVSDKEEVALQEGKIYFFIRDIEDFTKKAQLLDSWYKEQAETVFQDSLGRMLVL